MKKHSLVFVMSIILIYASSSSLHAQTHPELKINNDYNSPPFILNLVFVNSKDPSKKIFKKIEFPPKTKAVFTFTDIPFDQVDRANKYVLTSASVLDYEYKWKEIDTSVIKVTLNNGRVYDFKREPDTDAGAPIIRVINMVGEGGL